MQLVIVSAVISGLVSSASAQTATLQVLTLPSDAGTAQISPFGLSNDGQTLVINTQFRGDSGGLGVVFDRLVGDYSRVGPIDQFFFESTVADFAAGGKVAFATATDSMGFPRLFSQTVPNGPVHLFPVDFVNHGALSAVSEAGVLVARSRGLGSPLEIWERESGGDWALTRSFNPQQAAGLPFSPFLIEPGENGGHLLLGEILSPAGSSRFLGIIPPLSNEVSFLANPVPGETSSDFRFISSRLSGAVITLSLGVGSSPTHADGPRLVQLVRAGPDYTSQVFTPCSTFRTAYWAGATLGFGRVVGVRNQPVGSQLPNEPMIFEHGRGEPLQTYLANRGALLPAGARMTDVLLMSEDGRVVTGLFRRRFNEPEQIFVAELPPVSCPADFGSSGGGAGPDGVLDNNDLVVFISLFFDSDPRADIGSGGATGSCDGAWDNNDFIVFIQRFFAGC